MKASYEYMEDGIETSISIDHVGRIKEKGESINLIAKNEVVKMKISHRHMRSHDGHIVIMPDEVTRLSDDAKELPF